MTADSTGMQDDETRRGDRRGNDRRRVERRAPPPWWRTPWALVGYGVLGALLLVWTISSIGGEKRAPPVAGKLEPAPPAPVRDTAPAAAPARVEEAFGAAGFERMVVLGEQARGKRVRTELFCESPRPVAARRLDPPEPAVEALMDAQSQVPAAECLWGAQSDQRREEFVLLVPADLADDFAAAPVVNDNFIRRRRIRAEVEWLGRSPAMAVRIAGVLRGVNPTAAP